MFKNCTALTDLNLGTLTFGRVTNFDEMFSDCDNLTIYCEVSSEPQEWNFNWNWSNRPVYWAGQWEYNTEGNPVPIN